ncbi:MAG: CPBP family intramembrane glutamic endopeptidase [Planctomycetales bacterium]
MSALQLLLFVAIFGGSLAVWARIAARLAQGTHPLGPGDPVPVLPVAAKQDRPATNCPMCGTENEAAATTCRFCGEVLGPSLPARAIHWNPVSVALAFAWIALSSATAIERLFDTDRPVPRLEHVQQSCLTNGLIVVVLLVALSELGRRRLEAYGVHFHRWPRRMRDGALGFLASLLPVYGIQIALAETGFRSEQDANPFLKLLAENSVPEVVFWIGLSVIVFAPLAEELVYRVILQGWLATRWRPATAIVASSALFSLVHGWPDLLPLFPLALILGYVYHRTRSYIAVVTLHALFNGLNLAFQLLAPEAEKAEPVLGALRLMVDG